MSTASVAQAALALSNLRNRLVRKGNEAQEALFTNDAGRATALRDLVAEVDNAVDELHPFAFYTDLDTERLLGLSIAVAHARAGDADTAGRVLVELYRPVSEVA